MGWRPRTNCKHIDNWGRCKVHTARWLIRWMMPKGRPPCVFEGWDRAPQDDADRQCPDIEPMTVVRPPPPGALRMSGKAA